MIKLVSSLVRTSLFASGVLVLAGALNAYSDSCPVAAAKTEVKEGAVCETKVEKSAKAEGSCAKKGEACKAKCDKTKKVCDKTDGEKVKAACPKDGCEKTKGACAKKKACDKSKKVCDKAKPACTKADAEKVEADSPKEKECCGTCKPKAEVKVQESCPVMGGKINKSMYVDHGGKRVYVCCKGCIPAIEKDPAKYIGILEKKGVTLDAVPISKD